MRICDMTKISWYVNRLRAMSVREILWRMDQKQIEKEERKQFKNKKRKVTDDPFWRGEKELIFHAEKLSGKERSAFSDAADREGISLLGNYVYAAYKKDWYAGFQTHPLGSQIFSYDLDYKQRDEIGDARTNWELNRHFQFAALAYHYDCTGEEKYLTELADLFDDWNKENPFLTGISWTSVMEVAIRDINWIYTLGFLTRVLERTEKKKAAQQATVSQLCRELQNGIVNMTDYIAMHHSRYSSANNHLIVEAAAMGLAGIVMDCDTWYEKAFYILQYEMERQNYRDGVNKEVSLHYQSFFMEAVGLLVLTMQKNGIGIPQFWRNMLTRMSRYLADCQGDYGETIVFGDDDEGKILDLCGHENHYRYVLQLMSVILPERYVEAIEDQTVLALISERQREGIREKRCYQRSGSICYEEGGVSILKSRDGRALIGIDHGELGFGSIAAHGHADALSFQLFLEGEAVFADAGTYLYHIDLESRNAFRRTENHNTVTVGGKDQSQMLGAFLWGKRARTRLYGHNLPLPGEEAHGDARKKSGADGECAGSGRRGAQVQYVDAAHDGYAPVIHRRKYEFDGGRRLRIVDRLAELEKETAFQITFLLGEHCKVARTAENSFTIKVLTKAGKERALRIWCEIPKRDAQGATQGYQIRSEVMSALLSPAYGICRESKKIVFSGSTDREVTIVTKIEWEKQR